jgi:hypothetical protein
MAFAVCQQKESNKGPNPTTECCTRISGKVLLHFGISRIIILIFSTTEHQSGIKVYADRAKKSDKKNSPHNRRLFMEVLFAVRAARGKVLSARVVG